MKKILVFISFFLLLLGCSNEKTLVCTTTVQENQKTDIKVVAKWKNDKLENFQLETIYYLENTLTLKQQETFKNYIDESMSSWKNKSGINYYSSLEKNQLNLTLEVDASKEMKALEAFSINEKNSTYEEFKKSLEKQNYVCK